MRYNVRYHDTSNQGVVYDFSDGIEVVGVHALREDAIDEAMRLEKRARKHQRYSEPALASAA